MSFIYNEDGDGKACVSRSYFNSRNEPITLCQQKEFGQFTRFCFCFFVTSPGHLKAKTLKLTATLLSY
jgi:hypothetical protein